MIGWASSTCATDGERVYAFFGKGGGLFCYSLDGEKIWERNLGEFAGPWGTAAAPLLHDNLVIQNCDAEQNAFIVGIDKVTGDEVWRTKRPNARGWSSPIPVTPIDGLRGGHCLEATKRTGQGHQTAIAICHTALGAFQSLDQRLFDLRYLFVAQ